MRHDASDALNRTRERLFPAFAQGRRSAANLIWTQENLHAFISDPQATVKGNRMPYGGLSDPKEVDDVIIYLSTLK
jgi:cytochrome c2